MPLLRRLDHSIHYEEYGPPTAPPLLLIMGLGLSAQAWDRLPARLAERFRVVVFDNRGIGKSGRPGGRYRLHDFADDAAAVLQAVLGGSDGGAAKSPAGGPGGAHVFGISMGGMIAQELVLRHPQLVRSLVLGATFASWRHSDKPALRVSLTLLAINLVGPRAAHRLASFLVSPEFAATHPQEFPRWLRRAGLGERSSVLRQLRAIAGHSTLQRLGRVTAPTLVVTGSADLLVPPANSRVLQAQIPGARLVELPGAGHLFPLEREDETVRLLSAHFLSQA